MRTYSVNDLASKGSIVEGEFEVSCVVAAGTRLSSAPRVACRSRHQAGVGVCFGASKAYHETSGPPPVGGHTAFAKLLRRRAADRLESTLEDKVREAPAAEPARQTRRYLEKREAILGAAARLFNQKGIKGGTLADVAQCVGLITNSVTYYYRKKEELAKACFLRSIEVLDAIAIEAGEAPDVPARIARFVAGYFDVIRRIATGETPELLHFQDLRALPSPHVEEVFDAYTDMFRRVRSLLIPPGETQPERLLLNARAHLLLSQSLWARTWARRYAPEDYPLACARTIDILVHGLTTPSGDWNETILDGVIRPAPAASEGDVTPEAFLRAATQLVNEHGYQGASVDKISAQLNVTKGSFYHHHDTKEDLIVACFERTFALMRQVFNAAATAQGTGGERLGLAARTLVRLQFSDQGPLLRHSAWSVLPAELRYDKRRTMNRLAERLAGFVVDGIRDGSIRPVDQVVAAQVVIGMINSSIELTRWAPGATEDNAIALYVRPLLRGLGAPA